MIDLWLAVAAMCGVSIAIFFVAVRYLRDSRAVWSNVAGCAAILFLILSISLREFHPDLLIRLIPFPNVVVWGNFAPICVALLAAAAWTAMRGPVWQRILAVTALGGICVWRSYAPLLEPVPALQPTRWTQGVCRQSTTSTCSAAAAATLLSLAGIATDEAEMSRLCLTREEGTDTYGLYRGIRSKTRHVRPFTGGLEDFLQLDRPAVITIGLRDKSVNWLDIPARHSVVYFGKTPAGEFELGDPYSGRQTWTLAQLRVVWRNEAFILTQN